MGKQEASGPIKGEHGAKTGALSCGDTLFLDLLDDGRKMNSSLTIFQVIPQSLGPMTLGSTVM
jgi:hypothetical protein